AATAFAVPAWGQKTALVREAAEQVLRRLGRKAGVETAETLTRKAEQLLAKYGDDGLRAFRKIGPNTARLAAEAGEHSTLAVRLLGKHGDDAVWVASSEVRLGLVAKHGDEAAAALIRHGSIAEPVIETFGRPAAAAMGRLSGQNARRLSMMARAGAIRPELLDVIARYGDRAMAFVWKNKAALATASVLTAFVADPEPFLDGAAKLTDQIGEYAVQPVASIPGEIARSVDWTRLCLGAGMLTAVLLVVRQRNKRRTPASCEQ
ncbi:MAG: hypothetical protein KDA51_13570, partial [Planctomycetales bacterium]|nr:hypothetical protein [Planctomycetales bacterium]